MENECLVTEERGIPTHEGRYVKHSVLGTLFEVSSKYFPPLQPVGRGANGIVCCARNCKTKEKVAIKKIGNAFDNRVDARRTLREIKLLCHMDHENIIKIKDIIPPPEKENFNDMYIVYELMDTDLHQIICSTQPLNDDHCQGNVNPPRRGQVKIRIVKSIIESSAAMSSSTNGKKKRKENEVLSPVTPPSTSPGYNSDAASDS